MLGVSDGLEEWVSASDGIHAAMMDATWDNGLKRTIEGAADLRCKIQLDGLAHYTMGDSIDTVGTDGKLTFLYKPIGSTKHEFIVPGVAERSITFVFPILDDSLAGYGRNDPAVDAVLRALDGDIVMRRPKASAPIWSKAGAVLDLDRSGRCFDRLRRSKLDELACIVLDCFLESFTDQRPSELTTRERRQVMDARDLLLADLVSVPSLTELASIVGTNRTKLNQGFNTLFGMPVYRFLQRERMLAARTWLEEGTRSVGDVAEACGYEHVSNFSNAFKSYHGITPSSLLGG